MAHEAPDDRFERLQVYYETARELPEAERSRYVTQLESTDPELARELQELLAFEATDDGDATRQMLPLPEIGSLADGFAQPRAGDIVGEYRLLEVIASGGMGTVFRAVQEHPRREVALKVMTSALVSEEALARFRLEAEILGTLSHPGIAQIHAAGIHRGPAGATPYLAMELIDGVPLNEWARRDGPSEEQILTVLADVADAVEHAHQKGIIHRDLKPANVLVDGDGHAKVIDFGVARARDAGLHLSTLETSVGQIMGTLAYMSPEQFSGDPLAVDTRSDVYALGVVLYQLLAGRLPHDLTGKVFPEAVQVVLETEPRPLRAAAPSCSEEIEVLVGKAMDKDRERRYRTASSLADDIRRFLANEPVLARAPTATYRLKKFVRRNRMLVTSLAVIFVVLIAGVVGTMRGLSEANRRLVEKDREQKRALALKSKHEGVVDFFFKSFTRVNLETGSPPDTLREFLRLMARMLEGRFADDPLAEVGIRAAMAEAHVGIEDAAGAKIHIDRGLALERSLSKGRSLRFADLLRLEARTSFMLNTLPKARAGFQRARHLYSALFASDRRLDLGGRPVQDVRIGLLRCEVALGQLAGARGDFANSVELFQRGMVLAREGGTELLGWVAVCGMASARSLMGLRRFKEALESLDTADEATRLFHGRDDVLTRAQILMTRARAHRSAKNYQLAEKNARDAIALAHRCVGKDGAARHLDLVPLARILASQGRYEEAISHLEDLVPRLERHAQHEYTVSMALSYLGRMLLQTGRFDEAKVPLKRATEIRRRTFPNGSRILAETLWLYANAHRRMGELEAAETLAREAVRNVERHASLVQKLKMKTLLAELQWEQGDRDPLIALLAESAQAKAKRYGAESYEALHTRVERACKLFEVDRLNEAESDFAVLPQLISIAPARRVVALTRLLLTYADWLLAMDRTDEAETQLLAAYAAFVKHQGPRGVDTLTAVRRLRALYDDTDEPGKKRAFTRRHKRLVESAGPPRR